MVAPERPDDRGPGGSKAVELCVHCEEDTKRDECFAHCHEALDGKHVANPQGATISDTEPDVIVIDVPCAQCGVTGSTTANVADVMWD